MRFRSSDDKEDEILTLIKQSNDPESKAVLLILYRMSKTLDSNIEAIELLVEDLGKHRSEFVNHMTRYEANMNVARGANKVMIKALAFIQVVVIASVGVMYQDYAQFKKDLIDLKIRVHTQTFKEIN